MSTDDAPRPAAYVGRFAPSPTGLLHAGSLVAALASWLDARAHGGRWLVRIEDVDTPRGVPGADAGILAQLAACGLHADEPPTWQSRRGARYDEVLADLQRRGWVYPCLCTRSEIERALEAAGVPLERHRERVYPGTCRPPTWVDTRPDVASPRIGARASRTPAWRLRTHETDGAPVVIDWLDRRLGPQRQDVAAEVGDFVLRRADGLWAYQLAVVVDDADQGITDVVRGEDLADNTARQIHLQHVLGVPTPRYLHTPLVYADDGQKLSKQTGATAVDVDDPARVHQALRAAARTLGLPAELSNPPGSAGATLGDWLARAVAAWRHVTMA
jgi:glutamyl-Q tRNA(Asp) synthetase